MDCVQLKIYNLWLIMLSLSGVGFLYYHNNKINYYNVIIIIYNCLLNWYVLKKLCECHNNKTNTNAVKWLLVLNPLIFIILTLLSTFMLLFYSISN